MTDVWKGAAFAVGASNDEAAMASDQPEGTSVMSMADTMKPQGSMMSSGGNMTSGG